MSFQPHISWPAARHYAEAIQTPALCFTDPVLREAEAAFDRLGMPLVTSGQFAFVFKLKSPHGNFAVRCFRGFAPDREERYKAIHEHLTHHPIPALGSFAYHPEGIRVGGRAFPTLVMEWIEGNTLDVYLNEVLRKAERQREVLLHMAGEWIKLLRVLRDAGVAHGDLQHGNIIVEGGRLRLVDLDGMFVPALAGWEACEVGHQHYQHPRRNANLFDANLDNFSALVIYLSLVSLAEQPHLWREYHDENLLLTKEDFLQPADSPLLAKIKSIGDEHRKLAEALEAAALGDPTQVPSVIELVEAKPKLPAWMVAGLDLEVQERTREKTKIDLPVAVEVRDAVEPAPQLHRRFGGMPVTPSSAAVQSLFNSPPAQASTVVAAPFAFPLDQSQLLPATLYYAKGAAKTLAPFTGIWLISFRPLLQMLFNVSFPFSLLLVFLFFFTGCFIYGFLRSISNLAPDAYTVTNPLTIFGYHPPALPVTTTGRVVGSRTQSIYHLPSCAWASKIPSRNQIDFASAAEAQATGYRPCKICLP